MENHEIIIDRDEEFITGKIEAPLPEILSWGFDKLKSANKGKQVRQIFMKDPKSKQTYSITPVRDATKAAKREMKREQYQMIDLADRKRSRG